MTEYDQKRIANAIEDLVEVHYDQKHDHYVTTINDVDEFLAAIARVYPFNEFRWGSIEKFPKCIAMKKSCPDERTAKRYFSEVLIQYIEYVHKLAMVGYEL